VLKPLSYYFTMHIVILSFVGLSYIFPKRRLWITVFKAHIAGLGCESFGLNV